MRTPQALSLVLCAVLVSMLALAARVVSSDDVARGATIPAPSPPPQEAATTVLGSAPDGKHPPGRTTVKGPASSPHLGVDVKQLMDHFEVEFLEHPEQPQLVLGKVLPRITSLAVAGGDRGNLPPVLAERTLVMRRAKLNATAALANILGNMDKVVSSDKLSMKQGAAALLGHRIFVFVRTAILSAAVLGHDVIVETIQATAVQCLVTDTPDEEKSLREASKNVAEVLQQKAGSSEALYELLGTKEFIDSVKNNLVAVFGGENAAEIPRDELFPRVKMSKPTAEQLERAGQKSKFTDEELLDILKREGQVPQNFKLGGKPKDEV